MATYNIDNSEGEGNLCWQCKRWFLCQSYWYFFYSSNEFFWLLQVSQNELYKLGEQDFDHSQC